MSRSVVGNKIGERIQAFAGLLIKPWATGLAKPPKGYRLVVFAEDLDYCELCGEPVCRHKIHWSDRSRCFGPEEDEIEYLEIDGRLYGRRRVS
jgi:hypothetical protein